MIKERKCAKLVDWGDYILGSEICKSQCGEAAETTFLGPQEWDESKWDEQGV